MRHERLHGLLIVTGLALTAARVQAQMIGGDWRADVAAFAQRVVDGGFAPGISVAVTIDDDVVYAEGFGFADMRAGRKATGDTPFYIASTSKSLTALATVLAAGEGRIDLRAPMVRYLPDAQLAEGVDRNAITVHDLIALTHGLAGNGPVVLRTAYTGEFTDAQLLELLRHHAPSGQRGRFSYNNLGYNLAGLVLQSAYREPWQDVVARLVTAPIGMTRTTARISEMGADVVALPHDYTPHGFERMALGKHDANMHAAGGHFASARDLARYLAVHISDGMLDGRRVLPAAAVQATHEQRAIQNRTFGPYRRVGWAYGWDIGLFEDDTLYHRFGGFAGYRSHMSFMPAHRLGVVVLVNGGGPASAASDVVATSVYDRLLGKPGLDARFSARLDSLRASAERGRANVVADLERRRSRQAPLPRPLADYAGVYVSPRLGTMEWRVVAGGLELQLGIAGSRAEVFDAVTNRLRVEIAGGGQVVAFEFGAGAGPARAATLAGERFERVVK